MPFSGITSLRLYRGFMVGIDPFFLVSDRPIRIFPGKPIHLICSMILVPALLLDANPYLSECSPAVGEIQSFPKASEGVESIVSSAYMDGRSRTRTTKSGATASKSMLTRSRFLV